MSNPVEIVAKVQADYYGFQAKRHNDVALAVIAALEKEGYKVMAREPTEEMVEAAGDLGNRNQNRLRYIPDALRAAHDAAPRYGEPSE